MKKITVEDFEEAQNFLKGDKTIFRQLFSDSGLIALENWSDVILISLTNPYCLDKTSVIARELGAAIKVGQQIERNRQKLRCEVCQDNHTQDCAKSWQDGYDVAKGAINE
jgi:hypothetical protein